MSLINRTIEFNVDVRDKNDIIKDQSTTSGIVLDTVICDGTTYYLTQLSDKTIVLVLCTTVIKVK